MSADKNTQPQDIVIDSIDNPQPIEDRPFIAPTQLQDIKGFIETLTAAPTNKPKTFFDSIKIALGKLFVYDAKNDSWLSGGSQIAKGNGLSPASPGTVTITTGFQPKLIRVTAIGNVTACKGTSTSSATTTSDARGVCIYSFGTNTWMTNEEITGIVSLLNTSGNSHVYATISAITSNSFTINFQTTTSQVSYQWEAIG